MKASISIVVRSDEVRVGDVVPVFVHLHVFKPIKFRKFTLKLVCEEVLPTPSSTYKPPALLFLYHEQEQFENIIPTRAVLFEKVFELEGEGALGADEERNYDISVEIPADAPPTSIEEERYIHWYLKATLDKPLSIDINAFLALDVLPSGGKKKD
ncbi:MAG: hypothetical protein ACTSU5_07275 [Promethearchaeota archaeon]